MRNRALIALITICVAFFGVISITQLKQELVPSLDVPELTISSSYTGASPEVVENAVSTPIEKAISIVPGLLNTSSVSSTGSSTVTAEFAYGTDLASVEQKIDSAISNISGSLPANVKPQVSSASLNNLPILDLAVTGSGDQNAFGQRVQNIAVADIQAVSGVNDAQLIGLAGQRISVTPDATKLADAGLTAQSVTDALEENGVLVPGGAMTENGKTYSVQTGKQFASVAQIQAIPIVAGVPTSSGSDSASAAASSTAAAESPAGSSAPSLAGTGDTGGGGGTATSGTSTSAAGSTVGQPVFPTSVTTVGDVATVVLNTDPATSVSRVNGKPSLTIAVTKMQSANTVQVSNAVQSLIPSLETKLGDSAHFSVVFDQAPYITSSITSLSEAGVLGLGFAVVIIFLFLFSVRSTIVTAISIPVSVLLSLIVLWGAGFTLNVITLGGLTIAIGRVVDDSIVIIENIKRHIVNTHELGGRARISIVVESVREVAGAVTASTITTVAVFLPLAFVTGMVGELFRPFAITVVIALLASLFVALTIIPVLAFWFLRVKPQRSRRVGTKVGATPDGVDSPEGNVNSIGVTGRTGAMSMPASVGGSSTARSPQAASLSGTSGGLVAGGSKASSAPSSLAASFPSLASLPSFAKTSAALASLDSYGTRLRTRSASSVTSSVPPVQTTLSPPLSASPVSPVSSVAATAVSDPSHESSSRPRTGSGVTSASDEDELKHPTWLQRGYLPIIHWTLRHSVVTILIAVVVLVGTIGAASLLTTNLFGASGQNTLQITQSLPPGTSVDAQSDAARVVENKLRATKGVETVDTSVVSGTSNFQVTTNANDNQEALQKTIQKELNSIKDQGVLEIQSTSLLGSSSNNVEIDVNAPSDGVLQKATDAVLAQMKKYPKVLSQVQSNLAASLPYVSVDVNGNEAAKYGLTEAQIGQLVSQAVQPAQLGTATVAGTTLNVYLDNSSAPTTTADLQNLQIPTLYGSVALSTLADVHVTNGPASITSERGVRTSKVTATPRAADLTAANAAVSKTMRDVKLPAGATVSLGGAGSDQSSAFTQLGLALLAAILIVYIVMVATFKSLRQPLLLLISVPFAATGAILLQLISGVPLGAASLIGVLMLIGIVVTNAIVLVDLVNQYRHRGFSVAEAVVHGAARRLRPILMTALATIFALLPMGIGASDKGGFISQPLAIVVIGGLVSSTALTLIVLPTLYNLVEGHKERKRGIRPAVPRDEDDEPESNAGQLMDTLMLVRSHQSQQRCGKVYHMGANDSDSSNDDESRVVASKTQRQSVAANVDEYITRQRPEIQSMLAEVREAIRSAAPDASERIAWGMPTFWQGKNLIHFAAFKNHIGIFPGVVAHLPFTEELDAYETTKGSIHLPLDRPVPIDFLARITHFRVEQLAAPAPR